jgi:hypothetical protein
MARKDLPPDLQLAVARFAQAAIDARWFDLTASDLNMALPARELSTDEVEAVMAYLDERGIRISDDLDEPERR